jgi:hypothetical protein
MSITRFCRYVVSSMTWAKTHTIESVAGMAAALNMKGMRKASVPNTKARIRSAIGIAIKSSPTLRSWAKTGSRSCSIAACPET